jgi:hypothetical protein
MFYCLYRIFLALGTLTHFGSEILDPLVEFLVSAERILMNSHYVILNAYVLLQELT